MRKWCLFRLFALLLITSTCHTEQENAATYGSFLSERKFHLGDFVSFLELDSLSGYNHSIRGYAIPTGFFLQPQKRKPIFLCAGG
jgi:hypothetical protein